MLEKLILWLYYHHVQICAFASDITATSLCDWPAGERYLCERRWRQSFSPAGLLSQRADLDLGKLGGVSRLTKVLDTKRQNSV